jgi:D-lactate dehydrogenase
MCLLDGVEFFADTVLPRLKVAPLADAVALHPVCSLLKMGLSPKLTAIAKACSTKVTVPLSAGCCGFAGDRGWLVPELTAAATRLEAAEAHDAASAGHFSSSRTCEIGLTRSTGAIYRSFVFLLERASR